MIDRISGSSSLGQQVQQTMQASTGTFGDLLRQRMEQLGTEQQTTPTSIMKQIYMRWNLL